MDNTLIQRELKLQLLKHHLPRAQIRMKQQADLHRSDRSFAVGDWVYLKVQPYKQSALSSSPYHKLAAKYYGPFQIIEGLKLWLIHCIPSNCEDPPYHICVSFEKVL